MWTLNNEKTLVIFDSVFTLWSLLYSAENVNISQKLFLGLKKLFKK